MKKNVILSLKNLSKQYPGVKALDNVSIDFVKGEVHALVGENGAGKSTLIKCISGAIWPDSGTITIQNNKYNALTPQLSQDNGTGVIYQEFNLVSTLSVAENMFLSQKTTNSFIVNIKERQEMAAKVFEKMQVNINPSQLINELSPAQKQIVEIAKAISRETKILIMDEPTAPLTLSEIEILFGIIKDLKSKGVTIIYISHRLEELFEIADRVTVLRDGAFIDSKKIAETDRKDIISKMAGRTLNETYPEHNINKEEEILNVKKISGNGVRDISFSLSKGEILGFAGLVGAGRTEIMQLLYGSVPMESGVIYLHGQQIDIDSPERAIKYGIGYIPEDRKKHGTFLHNSIKWNSVINIIKKISKNGIVDEKQENEIANDCVNKLNIKATSINQIVSELSGGNQQKVVIAKALAAKSEILIFDEPTRGIDVGAKREIYKLIYNLADAGHAIIIVSSEMEELLFMSDRIIVISEGRQMGELVKEEFDQNYILDLATRGHRD